MPGQGEVPGGLSPAVRIGSYQAHLAEHACAKPRRKPLTYDAVERIWDREVRPRLPKLGAMKALYPDQEPPPKDSQWFANWRVRGMRLSQANR